ncbi:CotO family spore coat protein [Ornithinibacillus californiensis]|uniref:CotO family spore coat protein n=1 Tax=Ornithinibacillus californiensis TaxID=161536 RepID=UPI00064DF575|nr:CotO family spore coat protein [Ornithinibacillus californiensis]
MPNQKKFAREPLMYIQQPTISKPSAPMQDSYKSPRKKRPAAPTPTEIEKKPTQNVIKKRPSLNSFTKGATEEVKEPRVIKRRGPNLVQEIEEEELMTVEESLSQENGERKKFKDMTLLEKVDYFVHTPSHLPRMRCEVITTERKYRGVILDKEENDVLIRVGRRQNRVNFEDILEINLLGF